MIGVPYGLWKQPIDADIFGIQANCYQELRIPFACHVRYPVSTVPLDVPFYQFACLPVELQLRVLQFCNKPTLFRLMQTSQFIRREAMKLFFADPETWYYVEGPWLENGGHPTDGYHDIDFLRRVKRLRIEYESICGTKWTDEYIRNIWRRVQCLFPQATYVMVDNYSHNHGDNDVESLSTDSGPLKLEKRICQLCPQNINVFLSILHGPEHGRMQRRLWRRVSIQQDLNEAQELEKCESHPGPGIIVPRKPFRGRVGTLLEIKSWKIPNQKFALKAFRNAAIERHHFYGRHEPFGCPAPDCDAWFEQPEEYTTHLGTTLRHKKAYDVPEPYQSLFANAEKRLEQQKLRDAEKCDLYLQWLGKWDSEQRKLAEKEILREIEEDSLHMQEEPLIFTRRWLDQMFPWYDVDDIREYIEWGKNRAKLE